MKINLHYALNEKSSKKEEEEEDDEKKNKPIKTRQLLL